MNEYFISYIMSFVFPVFFDTDKGILFNFYKTLKLLGYPGFVCKSKIYYYFVGEILHKLAKDSLFIDGEDMLTIRENILSILKVVADSEKPDKCFSGFN